MPRLVVLDGHTINPGDLSWAPLAELGELAVHARTPPELVLPRSRGAELLITNKTPLTAETLDQLPELRGICVLATGVNVVDVTRARERGVPVSNARSYGTASVAEHTFALIFELCRRVGLHDAAVHAGDWSRSPDFCWWLTPQRQLSGSVLGVVGHGTIGSAVARAGAAFGMRVLVTPSRTHPPAAPVESADVETLFETADVVTLHCPLTAETRELVRWERLARMKRSAMLVNTARGGLVNEADLARALREQVIAGAALDVLSEEPPPAHNPLFGAPRCIVTPHLAWTSIEARSRLLAITAENARALLEGRPIRVVNP